MASEIRVNKIANRAGLSTVQYTDTGIIVSGIVTATELSGLTALNIAGVGTATTLDINGDIDVDGHTNLDNVSVAGVSTFSNSVNIANGTISRTSTGSNLTFQSNLETRLFHSSNNNVKLTFYGSGETLRGSIEAQATQIQIKDSGGRSGLVVAHGAESRLYFNDVEKFRTTNTGAVVTGILTATTFKGDGNFVDLDVDGHTNLDNVSIAGVTTFTGSGGAITVGSNSEVRFINGGSYGAEVPKLILNNNSLYLQGGSSGIVIRKLTGGNRFWFNGDHFQPTVDSTSDLGTNTTRFRNVYADTYYGDGANLTNLPAGAPVGGASTNTVFFENDKEVAVNYQITSTKNAMTAGPVAINAGIAVTVPSGCAWTIV